MVYGQVAWIQAGEDHLAAARARDRDVEEVVVVEERHRAAVRGWVGAEANEHHVALVALEGVRRSADDVMVLQRL